jgi:hypothetical protein
MQLGLSLRPLRNHKEGLHQKNYLKRFCQVINFEGLSGKIIFKNGTLLQSPVFRIINVIGKSYREIAFWSPKFGFSESFIEHDSMNVRINNGSNLGFLGQIFWPGGLLTVPKGWTCSVDQKKPLRIGVPATGPQVPSVSL